MSDLISRQAAIDALDSFILDETTDVYGDTVREILERLPSAQPQKVCVAEIKLGIDDVKDYIDKAINAERWIPCSERLPETPDMVLVTIDWGDGDYEVSTDEYWSIDGVETEGWGNLHGEVVTAWMPLPDPYKEEQE